MRKKRPKKITHNSRRFLSWLLTICIICINLPIHSYAMDTGSNTGTDGSAKTLRIYISNNETVNKTYDVMWSSGLTSEQQYMALNWTQTFVTNISVTYSAGNILSCGGSMTLTPYLYLNGVKYYTTTDTFNWATTTSTTTSSHTTSAGSILTLDGYATIYYGLEITINAKTLPGSAVVGTETQNYGEATINISIDPSAPSMTVYASSSSTQVRIGNINNSIDSLRSELNTMISSLQSAVVSAVNSMSTAVTSAISTAQSAITDALGNQTDKITTGYTNEEADSANEEIGTTASNLTAAEDQLMETVDIESVDLGTETGNILKATDFVNAMTSIGYYFTRVYEESGALNNAFSITLVLMVAGVVLKRNWSQL